MLHCLFYNYRYDCPANIDLSGIVEYLDELV